MHPGLAELPPKPTAFSFGVQEMLRAGSPAVLGPSPSGAERCWGQAGAGWAGSCGHSMGEAAASQRKTALSGPARSCVAALGSARVTSTFYFIFFPLALQPQLLETCAASRGRGRDVIAWHSWLAQQGGLVSASEPASKARCRNPMQSCLSSSLPLLAPLVPLRIPQAPSAAPLRSLLPCSSHARRPSHPSKQPGL